jgi:formylglycine-generating enzyme required for sulfatase activity
LKKYPNGNYVDLAQNRLDEIEEERKKEEANKSPKTNPIPTTGEPTKKISSRHGMQFTYIPPGEFMMGSSPQEVKVLIEDLKRENPLAFLEEFNNEMPKHKVTFKEGFYMGIYEVTQAQWLELMGDAPSARRDDCPDCPVEQVSWERAIEFIKKMNEKDDGNVYSLPTEAEWEYACRAGTRTLFAFGDSLSSSQANFNGEHPFGTTETGDNLQKTSPVGKYRPNGWGLYDMHGNVFEWCQDIYTGNYEGLPTDGSANLLVGDANVRVMRGGSYNYRGRSLRSADRAFNNVRTQLQHIGFRVVARVKIS